MRARMASSRSTASPFFAKAEEPLASSAAAPPACSKRRREKRSITSGRALRNDQHDLAARVSGAIGFPRLGGIGERQLLLDVDAVVIVAVREVDDRRQHLPIHR